MAAVVAWTLGRPPWQAVTVCGWARFIRGWSDPLLRPVESRLCAPGAIRRMRRSGSGDCGVGGLMLIGLLEWVFGFVLTLVAAAESGPIHLPTLVNVCSGVDDGDPDPGHSSWSVSRRIAVSCA